MDLVGRARIANGEGACFLRRNHLAVMLGPGVTCESDAMTDAWGNLHIDVVDDEIIVTLPLTSYTVTYYKPTNSPQLLAKRIANKNDPRVPVTLSEFLVRAWKA